MHYLATLALLFIFFQLGVMESAFAKLQLDQQELSYAMTLAILLSLVNVQLFSYRDTPLKQTSEQPFADDFEPSGADREPGTRVRIGVNLGGCILPLFFILYLIQPYPFEPVPALLLISVVSAVVYPLSRVEGRRGLVVHLAGAIISAALGALLLGGEHYLVWAYAAAVLGTLIGGDLAHLSQLGRLPAVRRQGAFIGGAGLMDAIFLSGIFAVFTAEAIHEQHWLLAYASQTRDWIAHLDFDGLLATVVLARVG